MAGPLVLNFFYCIIFMAFIIPDAAFGRDIRVFKDEKYIFVNFDYTDMLALSFVKDDIKKALSGSEIVYRKIYDSDVILSAITRVHSSCKESFIKISKGSHYFEVGYIYQDWNNIRRIFVAGFGFGCQTRSASDLIRTYRLTSFEDRRSMILNINDAEGTVEAVEGPKFN